MTEAILKSTANYLSAYPLGMVLDSYYEGRGDNTGELNSNDPSSRLLPFIILLLNESLLIFANSNFLSLGYFKFIKPNFG